MIKVMVSTIIDAPLSLVWAMVSDFNGLPNWHPAAGESVIEEGKANNEVGCIRNFALKDFINISEDPGSSRTMRTLCDRVVYCKSRRAECIESSRK